MFRLDDVADTHPTPPKPYAWITATRRAASRRSTLGKPYSQASPTLRRSSSTLGPPSRHGRMPTLTETTSISCQELPPLARRGSSWKQSCKVRFACSKSGKVEQTPFSYVPPMMTWPPVPGRGMMYGGGAGSAVGQCAAC